MKKKMIFKQQDGDHSLIALIDALFLNFPEYEISYSSPMWQVIRRIRRNPHQGFFLMQEERPSQTFEKLV